MTMDFFLKFLHLIFVEFLATWPVVLGVIAVTYRKQLENFLGRVVEIGPGGAKAVPPPIQQTAPTVFAATGETGAFAVTGNTANAKLTGTGEGPPAHSGFSLPPPDPVVAHAERAILQNLKERGIDNLNVDDQKKLFVREYAQLQINSQYQAIGLQIYGTQIALLRHLDNSPPQSPAALIPIFEDHKKRVAQAGIKSAPDFYSWIAFMLNTKLVAVNGDGLYSITPLGKQFLNVYAPAAKLTEATRLF